VVTIVSVALVDVEDLEGTVAIAKADIGDVIWEMLVPRMVALPANLRLRSVVDLEGAAGLLPLKRSSLAQRRCCMCDVREPVSGKKASNC